MKAIASLTAFLLLLARPGGVAAAPGVARQSAVLASPQFDVVSVKHSSSANGPRQADWRPGRFMARRLPLIVLITSAYGTVTGVEGGIEGGPAWVQSPSTLWDIDATFQGSDVPAVAEQQAMVRHLLESRFALRISEETRTVPAYALVIARSDGRLGPALLKSELDCASPGRRSASFLAMATPQAPGLRPACGTRLDPQRDLMLAGNARLADVVPEFTHMMRRPIIERTGLTDRFDFSLQVNVRQYFTTTAGPARASDAPSLPTALGDQLGLRLDSITTPAAVKVIEHVELPENN
jgi:uncharacterized protein (TIGR03435 family)